MLDSLFVQLTSLVFYAALAVWLLTANERKPAARVVAGVAAAFLAVVALFSLFNGSH